jgi:uncharacterized protein
MCERSNSFFPIGSVRDGYDFDSIAAYLRRYADLMKSRCSDCWAVRLCRKCIPLLAEGDNLPETKLDAFCEGQKRDLVASLTNYCRAREKKNDCFDWITDIVNPGA